MELGVPVVGRLEVPTQEMEKLLTFRVERGGGDSAFVTAREELVKLTQLCKLQTQQVDQLRLSQFTAIQSRSAEMVGQLMVQLNGMIQTVTSELHALDLLQNLVLLDPMELYQVRFLLSHFRLLLAHVTALRQEVIWFNSGCPLIDGRAPLFGGVVLREQPESSIIYKGKPIESTFTVEVVTGVSEEIRISGCAWCELVCADLEVKSRAPIENNEATMDSFKKQAIFHHLRPAVSTRMNLAHLRFGACLVVGAK